MPLRPWLNVAPALLTVLALFGGGLGLAFAQSLGYWPALGRTALSLDAYRAVFAEPEFWPALAFTTWTAGLATVLSLGLGTVGALLLRGTAKGRGLSTWLAQLNLPVPHSVGAVMILLLLGQSGWLARVAAQVGWIQQPADFPVLTEDPWGIGIVVEYTWKSAAFVAVSAWAALNAVDADYDSVARTLGASPWRRFVSVTLPLLRPALIGAGTLVFAYTFGSFEVPLLLGQRYPAALAVLAYRDYVAVDLQQRPEALALALLITAVTGAVALIGWIVQRRLAEGAEP